MKSLSIDIETYSSTDLKKAGVYKYAESEDFEILLFAYSEDYGPVKVVDFAQGEQLPQTVLQALEDEKVLKWAYNAQFERVCLSRYLGLRLSPKSWRCTLVWAATLGLPLSLEDVGKVLGLDKQKMTEGKELIRFFCKPCKSRKNAQSNEFASQTDLICEQSSLHNCELRIANCELVKTHYALNRHYPQDYPEKWALFKQYNARDVETEMAIQYKLSRFPVSKTLWEEYHLDQEVNDRGIALDMDFVNSAIEIGDCIEQEIFEKLRKLTGLENPNSVVQFSKWLANNGVKVDSLERKALNEIIDRVPEEIKTVLELRQQLAKNSIKKYTAMKNAVCRDSRLRGMFMFYGANRTGRFAGRIVQLHNLPQNHIPDLDVARSLVNSGCYEALQFLYDDVPDTLSQLIRTSFIPLKGKKFIVVDFSSIEARVLAWLAGEKWRLKTFAEGKDIYCQSASQMFGVPVEKNGVNGHLRQKGKIAELALGYGGSVLALEHMGALEMGLSKYELQPLVEAWRYANPMIKKLWWDIDRAVRETVKTGISREVGDLKIFRMGNFLFIRLPSRRKLAYFNPSLGVSQYGTELLTYDGVGKDRRWIRLNSYGPKLVENIVQGIARDILLFAMQNLRQCKIVAHVHDEIIIEANESDKVEDICNIMSQTPEWARGLLLKADGFECSSYRKA